MGFNTNINAANARLLLVRGVCVTDKEQEDEESQTVGGEVGGEVGGDGELRGLWAEVRPRGYGPARRSFRSKHGSSRSTSHSHRPSSFLPWYDKSLRIQFQYERWKGRPACQSCHDSMRDHRRGAGDPLSERPEPAAEDARPEQGRDRADEATTKNLEEQRLRGQLSNKASGAEGRAGVREGEGVRGPGQAPGRQHQPTRGGRGTSPKV